MKIKATFQGRKLQFLTSIHENMIPALGSDLNLYFFSSIKNMGQFTAADVLAGKKGYVDENKEYCFVLFSKCDKNLNMKFWEQSETLEEFLKLNENN